jgi:hypothetical protein
VTDLFGGLVSYQTADGRTVEAKPRGKHYVAQVVADTMTPCEKGEAQLLKRVGLFSARIIKLALDDMKRANAPAEGARLQ